FHRTAIWRHPRIAGLTPGHSPRLKGSVRRLGVSTLMAPNGTLGWSDRPFDRCPRGSRSCRSERRNPQVEFRSPAGARRLPQGETISQRIRRRTDDALSEARPRAPLLVESRGVLGLCEVATDAVASDNGGLSSRAAPGPAGG